MAKIYSYSFSTESGDNYNGGGWLKKPTEVELARHILFNYWFECKEFLSYDNKDYEWAYANPIEALEIALIYPKITSLDVLDEIEAVPSTMKD